MSSFFIRYFFTLTQVTIQTITFTWVNISISTFTFTWVQFLGTLPTSDCMGEKKSIHIDFSKHNLLSKGPCTLTFFGVVVFVMLSYQNAFHGCENAENRTWIPFFLWRTKVSEAVCKHDWHNVRSYLFFNMRKFRTRISDSVCNDLYTEKSKSYKARNDIKVQQNIYFFVNYAFNNTHAHTHTHTHTHTRTHTLHHASCTRKDLPIL